MSLIETYHFLVELLFSIDRNGDRIKSVGHQYSIHNVERTTFIVLYQRTTLEKRFQNVQKHKSPTFIGLCALPLCRLVRRGALTKGNKSTLKTQSWLNDTMYHSNAPAFMSNNIAATQ